MKLPQRFNQSALITAQVEQLIEQLQRKLEQPKPDAKDVHAIRVSCKKLRSWIRLLRHTGAARRWQQADKALHKIARQFARSRDCAVLQQTARKLQTGTRSQRRRIACGKLLRELQKKTPATKTGRPPRLSDKVVRHLQTGSKPAAPALRQGLQLAHERCIQLALTALAASSNIEALHHLRRWVKYLGYQHELTSLPTAANQKLALQLAALGRTLGQLHDLSELQQQLDRLPALDDSARAIVAQQISQQISKVKRQATLATRVLFGL